MIKSLILAFSVLPFLASAQSEATNISPYQFTVIKDNAAAAVDDQCASGTCWSFATISFLESEIIRKGNKPVDLSEMYNVRIAYPQKADAFVRYQGKQQFGPGGLSHDVIKVLRENGLMPESAFAGFPTEKKEYDHAALDAVLESTVKAVMDKKLYETDNQWKGNIEGILDVNIGKIPAEFNYEGKKYSAASFRDAMKLNADDYVSITSFSHHPFYSKFVLEVPDNWAKGDFYNLPLEEFMTVLDFALDNGYTASWDADVSEKGFSFAQGMAILPSDDTKTEELWKAVITEKKVDQANRQAAFDSFKTTDDHLMHITGRAKDQNGNAFYIVKNSWGVANPYKGFQYVSKNYMAMKSISIMLPKDAIPNDIKKKLGME